MSFRSVLPRVCQAAVPAQRCLTRRGLATANTPPRLYEYVVIINDLPTAHRPAAPSPSLPGLKNLSLMGNIVGTGPEDIRGEVLACQASSKEEIESHLQAHPLSKGVWDMKNISIWPLDTVHSTLFDAAGNPKKTPA